MEIGFWLPSTEFDLSPDELVGLAHGAEASGFGFLTASDHVLTTRLPPDDPLADMIAHGYHEPLLLLAALAPRVGLPFMTSVLVLPQRPAALVAKQIAELVWWYGDRFRFGVGSGWNRPEFKALGQSFTDRGAVMTEQIEVIARLWAERFVDFDGSHHTFGGVGIAPRPVRPRGPLWFGGHGPRVLERVVRAGEGWVPLEHPGHPRLLSDLATLRALLDAAGRDATTVGLEGRVAMRAVDDPGEWRRTADAWRELGATHLTVTYERGGFRSATQALELAGRHLL